MKTEEIKTWRDRITTPTTNQKNLFMSMQAEIDELRAALADAESGPLSDEAFDIVTGENQVLKAKLAELEVMYLNSLADATQWQLYKARKDAVISAGMGRKAMRDLSTADAPTCTSDELMQAEINELRAHISALESQEPIGEVSGNDWSTALLWKDREPGSPVYAEAGAAQVQQEPEPIQVCRLMKKEEGIWVAASEFYAGHPDQKWVKLVSTNPGSWSIQRRVTGKQIADGLAKALAGTQDVAAKYIGTCSDGDLIQPYVDLKKGTLLYEAAGAEPVQQEQASFPTRDAELWLTKNKLATHGVLGAAPAAKVPEDAP